MPRAFFRIVQTSPPTRDDFLSHHAQGRPPRDAQVADPILYHGISAYDSAERARRTARQFPRLGGFVARLEVPDEASVNAHKTLGPGHYTLTGEPDTLVGLVSEVIPVG